MQLIITSSKDTYITNKIIDNSYRCSNSNVGYASTLDLFKLYEESGLLVDGSFVTSAVSEDSTLLLKFDYDLIGNLTSSILNFSSNNFKAVLELSDVSSGLQKPHGFFAICNPLAKIFEEGNGFDVNSFSDIGSCNYLTSSYISSSPVVWNTPGAKSGGGDGKVKATGNLTITNHAGITNTATVALSDGTNTVTFTANPAANTPARISAASYTFGTDGATDNPTVADRLFAAIAAAKTGQGGTPDLNITATDPGVSAVIPLQQDSFGPSGNTDIVLGGTSIGRITAANLRGGYDTTHLDYYSSGSLDGQSTDFGASSYLENPNDNLSFDVTKAVIACVKGVLPNHGFRVAFSGSYSTDDKTRFVKRFASRHSKNKMLNPRLRIKFEDIISDDSKRAYLDKDFNLILKSSKGLNYANLRDNGNAELTGDNCGKVTISSGSFTQTVNFSQVNLSSNNTRLKGNYKATFNIGGNNQYIKKALLRDPAGFYVDVEWTTTDETITFRKDKIKIRGNYYDTFNMSDVVLNVTNLKDSYTSAEDITFLVSATMNLPNYDAFKKETDLNIFQENIFYKVIEKNSGISIIEADFVNNSTLMPLESGLFKTTFKSGSLPKGFLYQMQFLTIINGEKINLNTPVDFRVI